VRVHIGHVFAEQEARMDLLVRTVDLVRAAAKVGLANPTHDMRWLLRLERQAMPA